MVRFQPVLPLLKTNGPRRRGRTWHVLGLIVVLFLSLTFIAVRYLPTVVIDPVAVLKSRDFKDIFVPPIPRPPVNLPGPDHNHAEHIAGDQSRLKEKIYHDKDNLLDLNQDPPRAGKTASANSSSPERNMPVDELIKKFSQMSIEDLQKIQSVQMRREKVREVSFVFVALVLTRAFARPSVPPSSLVAASPR